MGAIGLILAVDAADERTVHFYRDKVGAEIGPRDAGWKCEPGLVPCRIRGERFDWLAQRADDNRIATEEPHDAR